MRIALSARLRNGPLWDLVQQAGSQRQLARTLGIRPTELNGWLNFRYLPKDLTSARLVEVEKRLAESYGLLLEDIFPDELRKQRTRSGGVAFQTRIETAREIPVSQLASADRLLLQDVGEFVRHIEEKIDRDALARDIDDVLATINPTNAQVIRERFGLNDGKEKTLRAIAAEMDRTPERIRQREIRALRHLRYPTRKRRLRRYVS